MLEQLKIMFLMNDYKSLRNFYNKSLLNNSSGYNKEGKKLLNLSYLFTDEKLPSKEEYSSHFTENENFAVSKFYDWKKDPPYKSPAIAGVLSTIIPGSGKIYTGETGDGIVAFLTSAVFSFIAYDNFRAGHGVKLFLQERNYITPEYDFCK